MQDDKFEQAIHEIRNDTADPAVIEAAAGRVWSKIETETAPIRGCAGFQALLADYRAGKLSEAKSLLVKDHLHECVACRKAYEAAGKVVAMPVARKTRQ